MIEDRSCFKRGFQPNSEQPAGCVVCSVLHGDPQCPVPAPLADQCPCSKKNGARPGRNLEFWMGIAYLVLVIGRFQYFEDGQ